ncbi:MAG: hypothetical protein Q4D05_06180 [Acinetobacter sp.]|nr:hypothetical protein [Acinetobacter sp.]
MEIHRRLGTAPPTLGDIDVLSRQLIDIFILACRARRYVDGVMLPLTVQDVSDVLQAYDYGLERAIVDAGVFAIDDECLSQRK